MVQKATTKTLLQMFLYAILFLLTGISFITLGVWIMITKFKLPDRDEDGWNWLEIKKIGLALIIVGLILIMQSFR